MKQENTGYKSFWHKSGTPEKQTAGHLIAKYLTVFE
jgi:hypothetical protein